MTALVYQVVWTRPLQLIFGSSIYAVSAILTTFLAGSALGSYLFRNRADNAKNPLLLFATLELGIGLFGLLLPLLFQAVNSAYFFIASVPSLQFLQFALVFIVLIIPSTLFGATWPVVHRAYVDGDKIGKDAGKLYSFNSFGSFLGPLAAGFMLIPLLGIFTTSMLIAALNILIAVMIFAYIRSIGGKHGA